MSEKKILFVAGAPRSGTTAMADLLNSHTQIIMLKERYSHLVLRKQVLAPMHFAEERMFTFQEGDSFYNAISPESGNDKLRARFKEAVYIGDKTPRLYEQFDWIAQSFGRCTILFLSRNIFDVAASYNRRARDAGDTLWPASQDFRIAVQHWNNSHASTLKALAAHAGLEVIGLDYESIMFDQDIFLKLIARLGMEPSAIDLDKAKRIYQGARNLELNRPDSLSSQEKQFLCMKSNLGAYRELHARAEWIR